ncbi:glycosyltransferase family 4 protein [Aureimonas sp. ME7]|uniref:glycosyltransferase family 4 protein n=1 Tax=Aureimonas sp. ME7 TaxID=2744252 RepID=UPI001FCF1741|nr:glycosyltransferase family 4 protein [Aureimonas sp. ME7]
MPKLAFIATEDWFFASHFLPMARAGVEMGLDVVVICRVREHHQIIAATGARVIALEAERRSLNPFSALATTFRLARLMRRESPAIVHCIALKPILLGGAAARLVGCRQRVYALTGLGFLGARTDVIGRAARAFVRGLIRGWLESKGTRYLFENEDDPRLLGLDPNQPNVTIVGGAGIDPIALPEYPMPGGPTVRIAVIARMLWSKGIDTAVEATRLARARGANVELSLFGAPDPSNPKAVPVETLRAWSREPGISWYGPTSSVGDVWETHHLACLPSRGGEGLPRTLLESASCGRPTLTTDVPGCRSFVREGLDGYVVPPDDPAALADAILRIATDRDLLARMGRSAARRVRDGYTEADVMGSVQTLYRSLLT